MRSYITLVKWLKEDLSYLSNCNIAFAEIKSQLAEIIARADPVNNHTEKAIKEKILDALNCEGHSFYQALNEIYLSAFFSKVQYKKNIKFLEYENVQYVINKRIETINYPHTLSFSIVFSDGERKLSQIDRASFLTRASLDFLLNQYSRSSSLGDKEKQRISDYVVDGSFYFCLNEKKEKLIINKDSTHILIVVNGCYYRLDVISGGRAISVDSIRSGLEMIVSNGKKNAPPLGGFSGASFSNRMNFRFDNRKVNEKSFEEIEKALFTVCLDLVPYGKTIAEEIFSHRFHNRYFGNTQFVIGAKGESAAIISYAKTDGIPAMESFRKIFIDSNNMEFTRPIPPKIVPKKIDLDIDSQQVTFLERDIGQILHDKQSSFTLTVTPDFFKKMNLSPNITLNFLLMLANHDLTQSFPVLNHAVSRMSAHHSTSELDWIYVSPAQLEEFYKQIINYPELTFQMEVSNFGNELITSFCKRPKFSANFQIEEEAKLYRKVLVSNGYEQKLKKLEIAFRNAVVDHERKIKLAKMSPTPTFLIHKPPGNFFDELVKLYLKLGNYIPGYRNYLFRAYRNSQSIDIMTSSLKLPSEIKTLGRHGSCSDVFSCYGLHILFRKNEIELVFIPNKKFLENIENIMERIHSWLFTLKTIFG